MAQPVTPYAGRRLSRAARFVIGFVVPFLSVIPTVPLLGRLHFTVFGVPLALAWLFACIPLTSACLAICWFAHDRYIPDEDVVANYDNSERPPQ